MIKSVYFKHDKTPKRIERITKSEELQAKKIKKRNSLDKLQNKQF